MYTWDYVADLLLTHQPGSVVRVEAWQIQHPKDGGLLPTRGVGSGNHADFRKYLNPTLLLRVRLMDGVYHASLVAVVPLARHAPADDLTPGGLILAATAFGALLGAALGGKNGAFAGALAGGMAGLAAVSVDNARSSPETAKMARDLFEAVTEAAKQVAIASNQRQPRKAELPAPPVRAVRLRSKTIT